MMYLQEVLDSRIPAITHVDNTARIQTINPKDNPIIYRILKKWKEKT
jgi:carbamoyltransferase